MTNPLRLTVLVDSEIVATDLQGNPLRASERGADRLAAALAAAGCEVVTQEAPLASAPEGWLLYFAGDPEEALERCGARRAAVEPRLVIMDVDRVTAAELMESLNVPFVVTSRSFQNWLNNPQTWAQMIGRTQIARALRISLPVADAGEEYADFTVPGEPLPEGIARCCTAVGQFHS